jgi:hypothetical protein
MHILRKGLKVRGCTLAESGNSKLPIPANRRLIRNGSVCHPRIRE